MAIRYKVDVLAELKKKGYTSTKIREEKIDWSVLPPTAEAWGIGVVENAGHNLRSTGLPAC